MIKIVTDIDKFQWQQLINQSQKASYFQTPECYEFYNSLTFLESFIVGVEENSELKGIICGYIVANGKFITRYFSRRAIIHGGPLLANNISTQALALLLQETRNRLEKKAIYIETRNSHNYSMYLETFENNDYKYQPYLNYMVETSHSLNKIQTKLSESKRRQIKKANDAGIKIIETKEQKDVDEFYAILSKLYKHKVKKPLFPKEFFEKLITLPHAHLFVAKYQEQVISGMACVSFNKEAVYEWFVCGNKETFNHIYPSVAVTYAAIEYASKNGYKKFDFMGAGKPNENYGVRDFKEKFGGDLVEYGRFICVNNHFLYDIGKTVINAIRRF